MNQPESIAEERWRPIPGYEGFYEASDLGRVRSLERRVLNGARGLRRYPGVVLKQRKLNNNGDYYGVALSRDGRPQYLQVHRLVLMAFVGPCPEGMEVCHNNGVSSDNRVTRSRWDTRASNANDRVLHGTAGVFAPKTECKRGHKFTPENTIVRKLGKECRTCARMHNRRWAKIRSDRNRVSA